MSVHHTELGLFSEQLSVVCRDASSLPFPAEERPWEQALFRYVHTAGEDAARHLIRRVEALSETLRKPVYATPLLYALTGGTGSGQAVDSRDVGEGNLTLLALCAPPNYPRSGAYLYPRLSRTLRSEVGEEQALRVMSVLDRVLVATGQQGGDRPAGAGFIAPFGRGALTSGDLLLATGVDALLAAVAGDATRALDTFPTEWMSPAVGTMVRAVAEDECEFDEVRERARVFEKLIAQI